jgi:acyl-CoA thioester hydrolase
MAMAELWRGCANAWECDELGHLNVRFYFAKAWEAVGRILAIAGIDQPLAENTGATVMPRDLTVVYLAEVRPGAPLYIEGGIIDTGAFNASVCLIVRQSASDKVAAVFEVHIEHLTPTENAPRNWTDSQSDSLRRLSVDPPGIGIPRGLSDGAPSPNITIHHADRMQLQTIGIGRINPEDCSVRGEMMPEHLFGKISNSVANFFEAFPEQTRAHREGRASVGGALLEARICIRRLPNVGEGFVIRSGVKAADRNVRKIIHWVFDEDGHLLWSMQGVAAILDLETRKIRKADDATLAALQSAIRPALNL